MQQTKGKLGALNRSKDMEKFQTRKWREGDIYSPHDLSWEEMGKWKVPKKVTVDAFDTLGINPLHEYKVSKIWFFFRSMAKIRGEVDFFWVG